MLSRPSPTWSHLPEQPLAPVPEPPFYMRVVLWLRAHGFKFVLAATIGLVVVVFHEFSRLSDASDAAASERVARSQAAMTPISGTYASLSVTSFPSEADVYLDGDLIGQTPLQQIRLAPGIYRLSVQKDAHIARDSTFEAGEREAVSLIFPLAPGPVEPPQRLPQVASTPPAARPSPSVAQEIRAVPRTPPSSPTSPAGSDETAAATPPPDVLTTGRIRLRSTPAGAEVWIKDRRVGQTPMTLDVEPGEYVATFKKEGYESPTTLFTVQAGQTRVIAPELNMLRGTLRVLAKPWGTIYVNGALMKEATNVRFSTTVVPGPVRVTVVHPLLGRWERVVTVEPGGTSSFVVDFNDLDTPNGGS